MAETLLALDSMIERVRADEADGTDLDRVAAAIRLAASANELADHLVAFFIDQARQGGVSWSAIGERLGLSRQAVQKRYTPAEDGAPKRTDFFDRMVPAGKHAIVDAQEQARRRRAEYIGTAHLLLGLTCEPAANGAQALARCGAPADVVTAAINGQIGRPTGEPSTDKLPFSARAKAVLEHALREAVRLGHDYVGTGHLALGCLTVHEGRASETLRNLGVSYDALRAAVADLATTTNQPT
jgi:hypothetical protein